MAQIDNNFYLKHTNLFAKSLISVKYISIKNSTKLICAQRTRNKIVEKHNQ